MADACQSYLAVRAARAVETVNAASEHQAAFRSVSVSESPSRLAGCLAAWQKEVKVSGKEWIVYVGASPMFPDEVPIACVADARDLYMRNPHVDKSGFICTIPDSAAVDSNDPQGLVDYVFADAERILAGTSSTDFQDEFSSYWTRSLHEKSQPLLVVEAVERLKNPFVTVSDTQFVYLASSLEQINSWISNQASKPSDLKNCGFGLAIHLSTPLIPNSYPNTLADLVGVAETHDPDAATVLKNYIASDYGKGVALLVQKEGGGVALGGVEFPGLGLRRRNASELTRGFRAGNVPTDLLFKRAARLIAASNVTRTSVVRADHQWVHSRGGDGRDLSEKSVLIIGCGSLGGYVAHLLSRAGVGRLTMTDNDRLGWQNLGRHILGASSILRWKAEALAEELRRELPHLNINGIPQDWRDAFASNPDFFANHDLVVSTVADWRCERPLNELARRPGMPPVFFAWLEPHAVAGHCLATVSNGGCFLCGANRFGRFSQSVSQFRESPISREPGGCTHYQHYGPTALLPIATMVASQVVDSLLSPPSGSLLSTWISSEDHFRTVQADFSDAWAPEIGKLGCSRTFRKPWAKSASCILCAKANS
jgi:molybdopterin/thiamine biosynthesis adenylyltransferase